MHITCPLKCCYFLKQWLSNFLPLWNPFHFNQPRNPSESALNSCTLPSIMGYILSRHLHCAQGNPMDLAVVNWNASKNMSNHKDGHPLSGELVYHDCSFQGEPLTGKLPTTHFENHCFKTRGRVEIQICARWGHINQETFRKKIMHRYTIFILIHLISLKPPRKKFHTCLFCVPFQIATAVFYMGYW